jgi:hypothetical protein
MSTWSLLSIKRPRSKEPLPDIMPDRRRKPERSTPPKDKICKGCGRVFGWTEKRAKDWDIAKYCSPQCSGYLNDDKAEELEAAILGLLSERERGKSICPSEAAKLVGGTATRRDWEALMEPAREAARRLVKAGRIAVTQKDKVVDPAQARGPIRLRLP